MTSRDAAYYCWDCHQNMTTAEYADRHTYHDHGCCLEVIEPQEEGNERCPGMDTHGRCCPICNQQPAQDVNLERRGHRFYPSNHAVKVVPRLYKTEKVPAAEKVIYLHYFIGPCDWWLG